MKSYVKKDTAASISDLLNLDKKFFTSFFIEMINIDMIDWLSGTKRVNLMQFVGNYNVLYSMKWLTPEG